MYKDIFESIRNEAENVTCVKELFTDIALMSVTSLRWIGKKCF